MSASSEATPDAEAGVIVAMIHVRGQQQPVSVRCLRPLSVIACESFAMADGLLRGPIVAAHAPTAIASVHAMTSV